MALANFNRSMIVLGDHLCSSTSGEALLSGSSGSSSDSFLSGEPDLSGCAISASYGGLAGL